MMKMQETVGEPVEWGLEHVFRRRGDTIIMGEGRPIYMYTVLALWSARDFLRLSFRTSDADQEHRPIKRKASLRLAAMPRSAAVMFL